VPAAASIAVVYAGLVAVFSHVADWVAIKSEGILPQLGGAGSRIN